MNRCLFIIVPCYNEEAVLPETAKCLKDKISLLVQRGEISGDSKILFVDDGSSDGTRDIIRQLHLKDPVYQGLFLSRNFGHQNALLAGLMTLRESADVFITIDADLQDDPDAIDEMLKKNAEGADIVYGVRSARRTDTVFKRSTAHAFYRLMGGKVVPDHADFRLMSRRAVESLSQYGEVNLFLRGIVPMLGYKSGVVYYERSKRKAGESKYPLKKMIQFAAEGITSLSVIPIRIITWLGFLIFFVSIVVLIYCLVRYFTGHTIAGWTTTVLSVWAIGGLIMISLGVTGEYVGRIYLESKRRPRYIVEEYLGKTD